MTVHVSNTNSSEIFYEMRQFYLYLNYNGQFKKALYPTKCAPQHHVICLHVNMYEYISLTLILDRTFVSMSNTEGCLFSKIRLCPSSYDWTAAILLWFQWIVTMLGTAGG